MIPIEIPAAYSPFRDRGREAAQARGIFRGAPRRQPEPARPQAPAVARRRFLSSGGRELKRPAVQGWACFHGKAFFASDRYRVVRPGSFDTTLKDGQRKAFLFDHDGRREFGGTDAGLEFHACIKGLAFRMPLGDDASGRAIYETVMANERPCVSIGADLIAKKTRWAAGIEYDDCTRVDLREISLVPEGAVASTHAAIVDLDEENPYLFLAYRSPAFARQAAVTNITARAQRLTDRIKQAAT